MVRLPQRKGETIMTNTDSMKPEPSKAPIVKLRLGLIWANVWQRITDEDAFYSVSFERRYRDTDGNWQSTHSYNADDLLLLAKLADQAHTEIMKIRAGGAD
jgi:hypothetical protein